ncbi:alpha/beta fold hydrolase [Novosphingobium sp. P6W]|jgi:pimeloyl-ACP methyl ester carboxylesterase|uniref:alpha/beta fold hydrolase n=1 Tax=Novosphingobium sp. P6W TaxID=1609758 RepID=UPI0005C328E5|nr:alpha/beta fold hydrolase [Novosphingobium sp. P6W]AXB76264.1 alpha/beta fold hydrolase [Novosphingobium sp. P6W]KIS30126.1 3-oxoadipate enol-lactone hydrolase [Novosphingobium sp. P6W]
MDFEPFTFELGSAALSGAARKGAGTPLVLVHGFGGSRQDWQPLIAALPADRPLIAYDLRGFGASQGEPGTPFSHADDLLALLGALEIPQADLCGMSLGGASVLNFALDSPERVRRMVLVSPLMVGWSWTSDWIERWKTIGRAARAGDIALARDLWWRHPLFDTLRETSAGRTMQTSIAAYHGRQWVQDDQRPALPDIDRLSKLSIPALLLTGERDTEDFRLIAQVISAMGQQVTCIDHAGAGHMLNLEIPEVIAGEIESFLSA